MMRVRFRRLDENRAFRSWITADGFQKKVALHHIGEKQRTLLLNFFMSWSEILDIMYVLIGKFWSYLVTVDHNFRAGSKSVYPIWDSQVSPREVNKNLNLYVIR